MSRCLLIFPLLAASIQGTAHFSIFFKPLVEVLFENRCSVPPSWVAPSTYNDGSDDESDDESDDGSDDDDNDL